MGRTTGGRADGARLAAAALGLGCLLGGGPAWAQSAGLKDAVEPMGQGVVNWSTGWVKATGLGAPPPNAGPGQARAMAQRAAYVVAVRNLLEVVKGVRIDSVTLVENFMVTNDVIRTQVSGFVRGAQVDKTDVQADGAVEVTVKVPLYGQESVIAPFLDEKGVKPKTPPPDVPEREGFTGLIIDARGYGVKPACLPAVIDEQGNVVYGPSEVDRDHAQRQGMAQYKVAPVGAELSTLFGEEAVVIRPVQVVPPVQPREGRRPLKLKGGGGAGALKANVMISSEDAKKIRNDPALAAALQQSRVVIVTDPLIGGIKGEAPGGPLMAAGSEGEP